MSFNVAVVGFGGAGTSIVAEIIKIIENEDTTTLYVVNDTVKLRDTFTNIVSEGELVKELLNYSWVIMTSGLGGGSCQEKQQKNK